MRRFRLIPIFLALFFVFSSLKGARQWRQVDTPHFRVFSDSGERDSRKIALEFERFREMFSKVFNLNLEEGVQLDIFLFRDRKTFDQYSIRHQGKAVGISGLFSSGPWENMIAMVKGWNRDSTLRTVFHEYTHYLVRKLDWPLWLNEGVAEFYSTFDAGDKEVTLGAPIAEHVLLLRERSLMPMDVMSSAKEMGHFYEDDSQVHLFYAQAWALVHLLQFTENEDLRGRYRSFLARIKSPSVDPARAFELVFGDYPLEKELRRYVRQRAYMVSKIEMSTDVELETKVQEIAEAVAVAHLGRLALQMDHPVEADEHFKRALRKQPDLPEALEGLARIALTKQNFSEAEGLLEKVVAQRPDDFLAHWLHVYSLNGNMLSGDELRAKAEKIIDECDQVIRINPEFSEAYRRLGEMSLYTRKKTALAVQRTGEGLEHFPRDGDLRLLHARLLISAGDSDSARSHLESVQAGASEPGQRAEAESMLKSLDSFQRAAGSSSRTDEADSRGNESAMTMVARRESSERPGLRRSPEADDTVSGTPRDPATESAGPDGEASAGSAEELFSSTRSNCNPAFASVRGVPWVSGTLTEVICSGNNAVYVVSSEGKQLRMAAPLSTPVIFSCEVQLNDLSCGPIQKPVVAYYVLGAADPFDAKAVAIEIKAE